MDLGGWLPRSVVDKGVGHNINSKFFPRMKAYFSKKHNEEQEEEKGKEN